MKRTDCLLLIFLSAVWGSSFLFMRVAAPSFGAIPLILVRVGIAFLCLLPFLLKGGEASVLWQQKWRFLILGVFNSALPFCLLTVATLSIEAGFTSVLNATTPLFAAVVAAVWIRCPLRGGQIIGIALGIIGVALLSWEEFTFKEGGSGWAILCGLGAGLSYGFAANYAKHVLSGVHPFTLAAGSMLTATLALLPLGIFLWPEEIPSSTHWVQAVVLAIACTAAAYLIYFHLIKSAGAIPASTVTFVVPVFAIVWGVWFLDESLNWRIVVGTAITLIGTAFTLGVIAVGRDRDGLPRQRG